MKPILPLYSEVNGVTYVIMPAVELKRLTDEVSSLKVMLAKMAGYGATKVEDVE